LTSIREFMTGLVVDGWSIAEPPDEIANLTGSRHLWDVATRKITATLTDPAGHDADIASLAFGPGGALAAADYGGSTYLWDVTYGKVTATLTDPGSKGVDTVAFGPNGIIAAGDNNGNTYIWNAGTKKITAKLSDSDGLNVAGVAFSRDGALATVGRSAYLWLPPTYKP
jgi:WD40 repeat protein